GADEADDGEDAPPALRRDHLDDPEEERPRGRFEEIPDSLDSADDLLHGAARVASAAPRGISGVCDSAWRRGHVHACHVTRELGGGGGAEEAARPARCRPAAPPPILAAGRVVDGHDALEGAERPGAARLRRDLAFMEVGVAAVEQPALVVADGDAAMAACV